MSSGAVHSSMMRVGWPTFMSHDTKPYCHLPVDNILRMDLVERKRLADTVTELVGDEKDVFLDFALGCSNGYRENARLPGSCFSILSSIL